MRGVWAWRECGPTPSQIAWHPAIAGAEEEKTAASSACTYHCLSIHGKNRGQVFGYTGILSGWESRIHGTQVQIYMHIGFENGSSMLLNNRISASWFASFRLHFRQRGDAWIGVRGCGGWRWELHSLGVFGACRCNAKGP